MKKYVIACLLVIGLTSGAYAEEDIVLAKVGVTIIKMSDFNRIIGYYDADKKNALEQNPVFKATILQRIVQAMVVSKIAKDNGFDKRTEIKEQIDLTVNDMLASQYLTAEIAGKINVTEEDMKLYYKMHSDEFKTPLMMRVRHILVLFDKSGPEDVRNKAREKAEDILKRIKTGIDFAKLAAEYSDDPGSKIKGGDIGFFQKGRTFPEFEKAALSLKAGEVSDIIETQAGFHIIKAEERKEPVLESYDSIKEKVREKVAGELRKARVNEFVESAMKAAGVEMNLDPFMHKK